MTLPQSWAVSSIGALADKGQYGWTTKAAQAGEVRFLRTTDITKGRIDWSSVPFCAEVPADLDKYLLEPGDIVISRAGSVGFSRLMEKIPCNTVFASYLIRFKPSSAVVPRYLAAYLNSDAYWKGIGAASVGIALANVNAKSLAALPVPLAPLAEQKRIADKLDTVLTRVDAVNTRLARVAPLLKRFRQSVLAAATSGRLTNPSENVQKITPIVLRESECKELPKGWAWRQLTSLARLESGHTPRKSVESYWAGGDVPWISLQDIREADGKVIFDTKFHPTNDGIANSSARLLPVGTVCFCRDISFGYVTVMGKEMATSQHFANWVCGSELLPIYLMYAFIAARDSLAMSGQGSTVTTIYMPALKALKIAVPPIHEQTEIVRRVETLFAFADRLEARLAQAQTAATRLTPALLAKAFRGELVPQDPNDEPAAELLRRLQAERATAPKASAGRGRKAVVQSEG